MHDIVIRGGTIVDGTGKSRFTGDVGISGDQISEVGGKLGPGRREMDAGGLLVTPGWVDVHTHYDGQAMWDPMLSPSCWHGVTTTMFGNCGVGFAPVRAEHRGALMDLMEGVEEIPGVVLSDGLTWEWESFPDFLDALERRPHAIDIAAQIAHLPLRVYVMGDRAVRFEQARPDDIAQMRRLTVEALRAGAFGFTTSRTDSHKTTTGDMVPSRYAGSEELVGIGTALGEVAAGAFGMNSDFDDEEAELAWMTKLAKSTGRPVWFLLTDRYDDPERWRRLLGAVHAARAQGASLTAQIAGRSASCWASAPRLIRSRCGQAIARSWACLSPSSSSACATRRCGAKSSMRNPFARIERRRRALCIHRRRGRANLHADALGPRSPARAAFAARAPGQAPDQRDSPILRPA
jgi:N-acyl-D-aspartate/D-glutamate deacylase